MSAKRFALTWVAATVALVILQPLFHSLLFGDFFVGELGQPKFGEKPVVIVMFILLYPALMTYVYQLAYRGGSPALEGARLGAIVGLFFVLPINNAHTAYLGASMKLVLLDTAIHLVGQGLVGMVIGLVAGRFRERAA